MLCGEWETSSSSSSSWGYWGVKLYGGVVWGGGGTDSELHCPNLLRKKKTYIASVRPHVSRCPGGTEELILSGWRLRLNDSLSIIAVDAVSPGLMRVTLNATIYASLGASSVPSGSLPDSRRGFRSTLVCAC